MQDTGKTVYELTAVSLLQWSRRETSRGTPQGDGSGKYGLPGYNARSEMRSQGERGFGVILKSLASLSGFQGGSAIH